MEGQAVFVTPLVRSVKVRQSRKEARVAQDVNVIFEVFSSPFECLIAREECSVNCLTSSISAPSAWNGMKREAASTHLPPAKTWLDRALRLHLRVQVGIQPGKA